MEKVQIGFRSLYRLIAFVFVASAYAFSAGIIHFLTSDPVERRRRFSINGVRYCRLALKVFHVHVVYKNPPPLNYVGLIVGNHMGFIDILAMASLMPSLFVTSKEMHETPVLGLITEFAGCVYVERRTRSSIIQELEDMIEFLRIGFRVVLYPEATSHNGEEILPFKRTLITAAAYAGVPVLPYTFNFRSIDGKPFSLTNRDAVCYYGDIPFYLSVWRMAGVKDIDCEIEFLPAVHPTPDDDRAKLANQLRETINEKFVPVLK